MQRNRISNIILAALLTVLPIIFLCSCKDRAMDEYYANRDNYISASGTVDFLNYDENFTTLYIGFSDLSPAFDDTCFKITGDNLKIVRENGIDEKLTIGTNVTFVSAPKYYGDGYVFPIVALRLGGDELLNADVGFENYVSERK